MSEPSADEIIRITQRLLDSVAEGDWQTYADLCDPSITAFEPEARGHLVSGMKFHQFYFQHRGQRPGVTTTISSPHVRFINDVAVISFVRLQQRLTADAGPQTFRSEETRIWQKQNGQWKHVHFHRSENE